MKTIALGWLLLMLGACTKPAVERRGEVIAIRATDENVESSRWGLTVATDDQSDHYLSRISKALLASCGDQFDMIVLFTTFKDIGSDGDSPVTFTVRQNVTGLGLETKDDGVKWGSHKTLQSFIDMRDLARYAPTGDVDDAANPLYRDLAHEFAHRWLAHLHYLDPEGRSLPLALIGGHWMPNLHTGGSVLGGAAYEETKPGTFSLKEKSHRYSDLDLYAMGFYEAAEVQPFFIVSEPRTLDGPITFASTYPYWKIFGRRTDIEIAQVIAADGPRTSLSRTAQKQFRMLFVLLYSSDDSEETVRSTLQHLDVIRQNWERHLGEFTHQRATVCTRASGFCG